MKNKPFLLIASGSIGDMLMVLAVCNEVRIHNKNQRITIFVRRYQDTAADLARNIPNVTIVPLSGIQGSLRLIGTLFGRWNFISAWKTKGLAHRFTHLFAYTPWITITRFAQVEPIRTDDIVCEFSDTRLMVDNLRALFREAGVDVAEEGVSIDLPLTMKTPKGSFPRKNYIILNPFGSAESRSFPPRRAKELLRKLSEQYPKHNFVILCARENEREARSIAEDIPRTTVAVQLAMLEIAGLIDTSDVYIGVDTGVTHLACVLQHRSIVLANKAHPIWLPYYNPNASILFNEEHCTCDGHKGGNCWAEEDGRRYYRCLYEITDAAILQAVKEKISS